MQTFLTSYDLTANAKVLDNKRLYKQFLEGYQILNVLITNKKAWSNHPAVKQWKGYERSLFTYITSIFDECRHRGIALNSTLFSRSVSLITNFEIVNGVDDRNPPWWGRPEIISSHRSRLLCKGEIDSICAGLKKAHSIKKLDDWLKVRLKKTKNQLKYSDIPTLKSWLTSAEIQSLSKNHYAQFGWTDNPAAEYVWPV